jgi:hypothetical protein
MIKQSSNRLASLASTSLVLHWTYHAVRMGIGLIFIWSGVVKLAAPQTFAAVIQTYGLIPEAASFPAALGLATTEAAAGIGLLFDVQASLGTITGLAVLFIMVLGYGIYLGLDVDCGCFGPDDPEANAFHGLRIALARDLVMLGAITFLYYHRQRVKYRPVRIRQIIQIFTTGGDEK